MAYTERSRLNHQQAILEILNYQPFKDQKHLFKQLVHDLVIKHMSPKKIIFSVIDLLHAKKIEMPNYVPFANKITAQYQQFGDQLTEQISSSITEEERAFRNF